MGTLADSLFSVLMSWVRALVNSIWALFSADHTTILEFLGKNWLLIALVMIAAGLVIDWLVWLVRWQPYHLWALRVRRLLHLPPPEEDEPLEGRAHAAGVPAQREEPAQRRQAEESWLPLEEPVLAEEDAREVMERAQSVPDEALGVYPGMRYGSRALRPDGDALEGTQRYAAVHSEGPGAAEVERRRAEIEAWQQQMQEEARARAQAERAAREAEQARLAQKAYEAEQARLAQEAYEAEQARLAQEEYQRQLAEYERQKEQYARDLAEYERQKAAYDSEMARRSAEAAYEAGQMMDDSAQTARRRRASSAAYSDYVAGEAVETLPNAPAWPQMEPAEPAQQPQKPKKKEGREGGLLGRMAKMIEPEDEEISSIASLPPRVDMRDAYLPPKKPQKPGRRKR